MSGFYFFLHRYTITAAGVMMITAATTAIVGKGVSGHLKDAVTICLNSSTASSCRQRMLAV